jgi:hypothetical protein
MSMLMAMVITAGSKPMVIIRYRHWFGVQSGYYNGMITVSSKFYLVLIILKSLLIYSIIRR